MSAIRVLIVDDSVVVRRWMTEFLASDPAIEVVGSAANASIALQRIAQSVPDIVLLDVEMPGMDGIEAVRQIRASWPKLPVVMCSALTERGAETTLRALEAGASDAIAKPSSSGLGGSAFGAELIAKVKALGARPVIAPSRAAPVFSPVRGRAPVTALAIGCSTGGPNALSTLFSAFPSDLAVPIFVVQHMPPLFTKILADRLTANSKIKVVEAAGGEIAEPGHAYVAPGNFHMVAVREGTNVRLVLNQDPQENSCRPAVDVLFRSLARVYGNGVLATVLTGMGQDGARGAQDIHDAGGTIIVQDAATCVVPSMPRAVVDRGIAAGEYPIDRLGLELVLRARRGASGASLRPAALSASEARRW